MIVKDCSFNFDKKVSVNPEIEVGFSDIVDYQNLSFLNALPTLLAALALASAASRASLSVSLWAVSAASAASLASLSVSL
jgi:hypothetical protein